MKALSTLAIEKVLLRIGRPVFDKVANRLQKEYKCYIPDCYEHPEYLESVLKSVFGNGYSAIVQSIREEVFDNLDDEGMRIMVKTLDRSIVAMIM